MARARALGAAAAALLALAGCAREESAREAYRDLVRYATDAGQLRRDFAPPDAPFSNAELARNFERIVFYSEFALVDEALVAEEREIRLAKWSGPIRYKLRGDAVTPRDRRVVDAFADRIGEVTGLRVAKVEENDNLLLLILSRPARLRTAEILAQFGSRRAQGLIYRLRADDYSIPCSASSGGERGAITAGLVLIKAEAQGLLRESCIHEEFAQVLGPGNDFSGARPSIFNDDGEFALMTQHDEYILRILYDARLKNGMSAAQAMPIVRDIIEEIRPQGGAARATPGRPAGGNG